VSSSADGLQPGAPHSVAKSRESPRFHLEESLQCVVFPGNPGIGERTMRRLLFATTLLATLLAAGAMVAQDAPRTLTFEAKPGTVTFNHAAHVERAKGDCATCHPAIWPAERADLGYKASMHKKAESEKTSCGTCHRAEGAAFSSQGNCKNCHVKE